MFAAEPSLVLSRRATSRFGLVPDRTIEISDTYSAATEVRPRVALEIFVPVFDSVPFFCVNSLTF